MPLGIICASNGGGGMRNVIVVALIISACVIVFGQATELDIRTIARTHAEEDFWETRGEAEFALIMGIVLPGIGPGLARHRTYPVPQYRMTTITQITRNQKLINIYIDEYQKEKADLATTTAIIGTGITVIIILGVLVIAVVAFM